MYLITVQPTAPGWVDLRFGYNKSLVEQVKKIPGCRWDPERKCWVAPEHALPALATELGQEARFTVSLASPREAAPPAHPAFISNLRPYQSEAVQKLLAHWNSGFLLAFDMRVGKGGRADDRVLTPRGWVAYKNLAPGMQVIGSSGRACAVKGVYRRGVLPFVKVTFTDGASVSVSTDHLWAVQSATQKLRGAMFSVVETSELMKQAPRDAAGNSRFFIPVVEPVEWAAEQHQSLPLHPYIVGVLLGDGHISPRGSVTFCPGDAEVPACVASLLPQGVTLHAQASKNRATTYSLRGCGKVLRRIGLRGRSWEKRIPPAYLMNATAAERADLLRGLLDTDGYVTDTLTQFTTTSPRLADDVTFLARSLGGVVRRSDKLPAYSYLGAKKTGRRAYTLTLTMPTSFNPSRARGDEWVPRVREPVRAISSITPDGEAECICIEVDAPDSLYVTEHFIVTHNTRPAAAAAASALACGASRTSVHFMLSGNEEVWRSQFKEQTGLDLIIMEGTKTFEPAAFDHYRTLPHLAIGLSYELMSAARPKPAPVAPGQTPTPVESRLEELLRLVELRGPFTLIADEVQFLKNPKAPRTKFVLEHFARSPHCKARWALSGTPQRNFPRDLYTLFDFIQPDSMGSRSAFGRRYCDGHMGDYGWVDKGRTNEAELSQRLGHIMFRLTRRDVAQWLPVSDRSVILCDMSAAEMKRYQKQEAALGASAVTAMNGGDSSTALGALKQLSLLTAASKVTAMIARVQEHVINRGVKVVVFAYNHETLKLAEEKYTEAEGAVKAGTTSHAYVAGGWLGPDRRHREIEAWKAHQGGAVLFANTLSSGVGIDLADAEVSVFIELAWVPADFLQAEARTQDVHLGKATTKRIYEYLLTRGTIDTDMGMKLIEKMRSIDAVVGPSSESSGLSNALGDSGLVDRNQLSLSSESKEVVDSVLAGLRARLFADETPEVSDTGDNEDAEDTDDEEAEEEAPDQAS